MAGETSKVAALAFVAMIAAFMIVFIAGAAAEDTRRLGAANDHHRATVRYITERRDAEKREAQEAYDRAAKLLGGSPPSRGYLFK